MHSHLVYLYKFLWKKPIWWGGRQMKKQFDGREANICWLWPNYYNTLVISVYKTFIAGKLVTSFLLLLSIVQANSIISDNIILVIDPITTSSKSESQLREQCCPPCLAKLLHMKYSLNQCTCSGQDEHITVCIVIMYVLMYFSSYL